MEILVSEVTAMLSPSPGGDPPSFASDHPLPPPIDKQNPNSQKDQRELNYSDI